MAEKNTVKVLIEGKAVTLGGYESAEYLEQVAYYINHKIAELRDMPGYLRQSADMKSILLALNIADDYCKAKQRADSLEQDMESKDGEGYEVKQDLVSARVRIQQLERELAAYRQMHEPVQMELHDMTPVSAPDPSFSSEEVPQGSAALQDVPASNDKYMKRSKRYVKNRAKYE